MKYTNNYHLNKPDVGDEVNIQDINSNMDVLDTIVGGKVNNVEVQRYHTEQDSGVDKAATITVDGRRTDIYTSDKFVGQFDLSRDDRTRGILFSEFDDDSTGYGSVYKSQDYFTYNLDASEIKLKSVAATYRHMTISPSDIVLSGHLDGGRWDGTNASLVDALQGKLSASGGSLTGTIVTSGSDDPYVAIRPNTTGQGWIGSGSNKFARMYATSFYGDVEGGIRQVVANRDDVNYPVIFSTMTNDEQVTAEIRKDSQMKFNPQYCNLTIGGVQQRTSSKINQDGLEHHVDVGVAVGQDEEYVDTWSQVTYEDIILHSEDSQLSPNTWDGTNTSLRSALSSASQAVKVDPLDQAESSWRPVILAGPTSQGSLNRGTLTYQQSTCKLKNSDGSDTMTMLPNDITLTGDSNWYDGATSLKAALKQVEHTASNTVTQHEIVSPGTSELLLSDAFSSETRTAAAVKTQKLYYTSDNLVLDGDAAGLQLNGTDATFLLNADGANHNDMFSYNTGRGQTYQMQDNGIFSISDGDGNDVTISNFGFDCSRIDNESDITYGVSMSSLFEDINLYHTTWDGTHSSLKAAISSMVDAGEVFVVVASYNSATQEYTTDKSFTEIANAIDVKGKIPILYLGSDGCRLFRDKTSSKIRFGDTTLRSQEGYSDHIVIGTEIYELTSADPNKLNVTTRSYSVALMTS